MIPQIHQVLELLEGGFGKLRVLVVGDVMLDRYILGEVDRISPEAPVPVLRHVQRYERAGGAANVAMNLRGLGCQAWLAGFWGGDAEQAALAGMLQEAGIDAGGMVTTALPTISKTRIIGRTQQMMRLDIESQQAASTEEHARLRQRVLERVREADVLILSDYAKGVLQEELCRGAIAAGRERGIPVLVDPKTPAFARYAGATTVCPNLQELAAATGVPRTETDALIEAGRGLLREHGFEFLVATMSEKGIRVLTQQESYHSPARAREVFDVSGAGDTVIATLAAALAGGLEVRTAVDLANLAAGIVVGKMGTVPIAQHELIAALTPSAALSSPEKVLDRERMRRRVEEWRAAGESIVFTNGCFDLLHIGHITLLEDCRRFGTKLVVGLNTDASVSRLKGPSRPLVNESDRARVMAALGAVDGVTLFDEDTPLELIRELRPTVLVKGGDYNRESVVGHQDVESWGGRVEIVPTVEGFSTTNLVKKIAGNGT